MPAKVRAGARGRPIAVGDLDVDCILEDWLVEDRWWTGRALRRRYFECVLSNGSNAVVFQDLVKRRWFRQRA